MEVQFFHGGDESCEIRHLSIDKLNCQIFLFPVDKSLFYLDVYNQSQIKSRTFLHAQRSKDLHKYPIWLILHALI